MIRIEEARSRKAMRDFVDFPFRLYKDSPFWVPPLIKDELNSFDPAVNPIFQQAAARFFLAYKDQRIVGRVAAIVNWTEVRELGLPKMRFGWFDFEDDPEVSRALLEAVAEVGRDHGLEYMEGPMGFSNLDKVGVLTEGFDSLGSMVTWYNYPYYKDHLTQLGFEKEKEYLESTFPVANADPALFVRTQELIRRRFGLRPLNFSKTSQIMPWVDQMFDLFNETYARLASHVPISEAQKEFFKKKYISFINPEYIKFIVDAEDKMVAFAIVMPNYSEALKKANGRLYPFGLFHLLRARKHNKDAVFYLIGILPEYQNKGLTAIIFNEYYEVFKQKGITTCYRTPELAENIAIQQMWKHFDPRVYKQRATFKKAL